MSRLSRASVLVALAALASACSSIPNAAAMQVTDVTSPRSHDASVAVRAAGGQDFDFRIADAQLQQAIVDSLLASGVFREVVGLGSGDYRLDVVLGDGTSLETKELTVLWSLSRVDTQETVWQEFITSKGRSSHFVGVVRQRRSMEYAAKENIRLGIERLSRAKLPAP